MKLQRITMRTVADEAGVSVQTVSRVLNDHPDVADATAMRIREVIERLNYTPNAIARSLIQQRSYTIGVAIDVLEWIGPANILAGISYEADENEFCLLVKRISEGDTKNIDSVLQVMLSRQVDGIIWAVPEINHNHDWAYEKSMELDVPIVFITMPQQEGVLTVSMDNYRGGCLATQHLLDQGYRNIALISGPLDWWEARERKKGWADTLTAAGLPPTAAQAQAGDILWSAESAEVAFLKLLETYPQMDAVFACSDYMALKVLQIAQRLGMRIPQDLGVIGYDGIQEAAYYSPSLSTINHDHVNLGIQAIRSLVQHLDRPSKGQEKTNLSDAILLQPNLVIRGSTAV